MAAYDGFPHNIREENALRSGCKVLKSIETQNFMFTTTIKQKEMGKG